ncbi:MAG TPA: HAMP domain-containing sensor histidine kinase, partial [Anaerovoracaceae bacterium]|nr:HAMP domain-containing sensor histidine kinase [Anaerovoracaceae bacterium]
QLRLVNNMIDITKIDSGFYDLGLQNLDIVRVVENITMSVSDYIRSKSVNLIFDTDFEERIIAFDPDSIERIMLNLLSNAVKFSKEGGTIHVNMHNTEEEVIVSVRDTGIGIPEDKKELIFDRFRQVDKSLTRNHEGSGIGLALVKSLVGMHGGSISVQSDHGIGTIFIFSLPAKTTQDEKVPPAEKKPKPNIEKIHLEFSDIYSIN